MEWCFLNSQFGVFMLLAWAILLMLGSETEFHNIVTYTRMNQSITYSISDISDFNLFVSACA